MVPHQPYSPDLAPCDFFLFPRLKNQLYGTWFWTLELMKEAVYRSLRAIPPEDFESALMSMPIRWMKCVTTQGEYFKGAHLTVDLEHFGIEIVFGEEQENSEDNTDTDSEEEAV